MSEQIEIQQSTQFKDRKTFRALSNCLVLAAWFGAMYAADVAFGFHRAKMLDASLALIYLAASPLVTVKFSETWKKALGFIVIANLLIISSIPLFYVQLGLTVQVALSRHIISLLFCILLGPYFLQPKGLPFFFVLFYNALCFYIPMMKHGEVDMNLAYIVIVYSFTLLFSYFFIDILRLHVTQISLLIKAHKEAQKKAIEDSLTGVYNRNYLDNFIKALVESDVEKVLLFISLDDHDKIVENHGHIVADAYIKKAAKMIAEKIRSKDVLARYGGVEFMVILDNPSINLGQTVARRILSGLKEIMPEYSKASIGITKIVPGITYQAVMVNADTALFRAKNSVFEDVSVVDPENPTFDSIHFEDIIENPQKEADRP